MRFDEYVKSVGKNRPVMNHLTGLILGPNDQLTYALIELVYESGRMLELLGENIFLGKLIRNGDLVGPIGSICRPVAVICDIVSVIPDVIEAPQGDVFYNATEISYAATICMRFAGHKADVLKGMAIILGLIIRICEVRGLELGDVLETDALK